MAPASTPALALAYLRELSADVRAGVVLEGDRLVAGPPALEHAALELRAVMGPAGTAEGRTSRGAAIAACAGGLTIVLACGPRALGELTRHDLGLALEDLGAGGFEPGRAPAPVPSALVEALLAAAPRAPEG